MYPIIVVMVLDPSKRLTNCISSSSTNPTSLRTPSPLSTLTSTP